MSTTAETEKMLADMTRAEKAELLRWIVRDRGDDFPGIASPVSLPRYRFRGIKSKPNVMGGVPCMTRTRILSDWSAQLFSPQGCHQP
jgi:hypothetical protein